MQKIPFLIYPICLLANASALGGGIPWMDADWNKRIPLTLSTTPDSTMHDVVLLVDKDNAHDVFAAAKSDGSDLRMAAGDGMTALPFHLVSYDAASETVELWFKSDEIGPSSTRFYLYYGNSDASPQSNAASTWSEFDAVYTYQQSPGGTLSDVSGNGNHAARVGGTWNASHHVAGKIGRAWNYGSGRTMGVWGKQITAGGEWTVSAWARATTRSTDFLMQGNPCFFSLHIQASNVSWDTGQYKNDYCPSVGWSIRTSRNLDIDSWRHHSWSTDAADSVITYSYNGQRVGYNVQTDRNFPNVAQIPNVKWRVHPIGSTQEGVGIGSVMYANNQDDMQGDVDHFTIRSFKLPAKLLAVEVANQASPAAFWITGPPQDRPLSSGNVESLGAMKGRFGG